MTAGSESRKTVDMHRLAGASGQTASLAQRARATRTAGMLGLVGLMALAACGGGGEGDTGSGQAPGGGGSAAPLITQQPSNQTTAPPDAATFTVAASGSPAPSIQWQVSIDGGVNWTALSGATGATYTTSSNFQGNGRAMNNGRRYRAIATNASGSATSAAAVWSVRPTALGGLPNALHMNAAGELVVLVAPNYGELTLGGLADRGAALLQRVSAAGAVAALAGTGVQGLLDGAGATARFNVGAGVSISGPVQGGIGRDAAGNVYVADRENNVVRRVAPDGTVSTFAGSGLRGTDDGTLATARFSAPTAVAVASDGTVYVADATRLRKIAGGNVSTVAVLNGAFGLAIDTADTVHVLNAASIGRVTAAGASSQVGGLGGLSFAEDASVDSRLGGLVVDAAGTMYATDPGLCLVRKITAAGVVTTLAGGPLLAADRCGYADGSGRAARFSSSLRGIALDAAGNLYVADGDNLAIRKITPTGVVSTLAR